MEDLQLRTATLHNPVDQSLIPSVTKRCHILI